VDNMGVHRVVQKRIQSGTGTHTEWDRNAYRTVQERIQSGIGTNTERYRSTYRVLQERIHNGTGKFAGSTWLCIVWFVYSAVVCRPFVSSINTTHTYLHIG